LSDPQLTSAVIPILQRACSHLYKWTQIVIFLKKLAIFKENLPAMREHKVVAALMALVPNSAEAVLVTSLRLLYNLSFDRGCREAPRSAAGSGQQY